MNKSSLCLAFTLLLIFSSLSFAVAEEQDECEPPTVSLETPASTTPNSYVQVKVSVTNTTGFRMWHTNVELDVMSIPSSIRQYLEFDETEIHITEYKLDMGKKDYLSANETESVTFLVKVTKDAPAMTIPFYVSVTTEIGECEEGCAPFYHTYETITNVIRSEPSLLLEMDTNPAQLEVGDCYIAKGSITRDFTITNSSQSTAFNIDVSIPAVSIPISITTMPPMPITILQPGKDMSGTFYITTGNLSVGTYSIPVNLTYEDYYNKQYSTSTSFNIIVTSSNYELFTEAELYFASCDYENARSRFVQAQAIYESIENTTMAERCTEYIERIDGNNAFMEGQSLYCQGEFDQALDLFTQAKTYYVAANDCFGEELCDTIIDTCSFENGVVASDSSNNDNGSGISTLDIFLLIIVFGLIIVVAYLFKKE